MDQLDDMEKGERLISLPVVGAVLAARVRLSISAGLVDLNKLLKEATVRRNVVVQLIRMHKDSGHPDYADVDMAAVVAKAAELADTDDAVIPNGLSAELESEDESNLHLGVDKAATPAATTSTVAKA